MFSQILVSLLTTCRGGYKIHCALGETWKPCIFTLASTVASTTTVTFVLTYARFILQLPLFFFFFNLIHQNSSAMQEHHAQSPVTLVSHAIKWYTFSFNFASLLMPILMPLIHTPPLKHKVPNIANIHRQKSSVQSCSDSLLCAGVIDLTVPEDSTRNTVARHSSTNINEPIGLHWGMTAAGH